MRLKKQQNKYLINQFVNNFNFRILSLLSFVTIIKVVFSSNNDLECIATYLKLQGFTEKFFNSVQKFEADESLCELFVKYRMELVGKQIFEASRDETEIRCFNQLPEYIVLSLRIEGTKIKLNELSEVDDKGGFWRIFSFGAYKGKNVVLRERIADLEYKRRRMITNGRDLCRTFREREKYFGNYFNKVIMNRNGLYKNSDVELCISVHIIHNDEVFETRKIFASRGCDQNLRNIFGRFLENLDSCWWNILEQHKYYENILQLHFWTNISDESRLRKRQNFIDAMNEVEMKSDRRCPNHERRIK